MSVGNVVVYILVAIEVKTEMDLSVMDIFAEEEKIRSMTVKISNKKRVIRKSCNHYLKG